MKEPIAFFLLILLSGITFFTLDDTEKPTQEEFNRVVAQCNGQRIGDPAFRFPYKMSCDEWVKIKLGDNKYTQQYLDEMKGPAEKEGECHVSQR